MLQKIIIKKLFNRFNYNINLDENGITILTGPNGYGKTTILRIIKAFSTHDFLFFVALPFKEISFVLGNMSVFSIFKPKFSGLDLEMVIDGKKIVNITRNELKRVIHGPIKHHIYFNRNHYEMKREPTLNGELHEEIKSMDGINRKKVNFLIQNDLGNAKLLPTFYEVYYIDSQRLTKLKSTKRKGFEEASEKQLVENISEYSNELKRHIFRAISTYSTKATELDSSFPKRLFSEKSTIDKKEFKKQVDTINVIQKILNKYKIIDIQVVKPSKFRDEDAKALFVYVNDTLEKLSVFNELLEKLRLFEDLINNGKFSFKTLVIDRDQGFNFFSEDHTPIALSDLSSGEKQQVILTYELLFKTEKSSIVLIDEPELSLHVAWQKEFINNLRLIQSINGFTSIIATHSPSIVDLKWELTRDLYELQS